MKRERWIVSGLFVGAVLLRGLLLGLRPFDGLYGQDAFAYYNYALELRTNLLENGIIPAFFWPIGFPLHLVFAFSVLGVSPQAAQWVNVIAGALVAPLTFALTREVLIEHDGPHARSAALVAGLSVAVGGQLMISSLSIMSDATALMWATLSAWSVLRYARTLQGRWFGLAVLALAVAVITRWAMALLAVPWTLATLATWRERWSAVGWRRIAALCASTALIGGVIVGGQLLSGSHTGDLGVVSWNPVNAVQRDVINADGVLHYALPMAVFYAQPLAHPAYLFPLFLPFLIGGVYALRKTSATTRVLLIGWPLSVYVFLSGIAWQNPRFMLPLLPPLIVWVAAGLDRVMKIDRRWRLIGWAISVISLIGMVGWSGRVVGNFVDRKNADLAVVGQLDRWMPPESTLLAFGLTATAQQYTDLRVIELFHETPDTLAARLRTGAVYVLIDEANITAQWTGKSPAINFEWLQTQARLTPLAALPPYRLFRAEAQ